LAKKQKTLFEQAKSWWQTDTAKAIGTVIAVLLIPASVVAWNYASKDDSAVLDEGASTSMIENESSDEEESSNNNATEEQASSEELAPEIIEPVSNEEIGGISEVEILPNTSAKE